jgi:hypothetical protein
MNNNHHNSMIPKQYTRGNFPSMEGRIRRLIFLRNRGGSLHIEPNVQECDTTDDQQNYKARNIKKIAK